MHPYLRKTLDYTAGNIFRKLMMLLLLPVLSRFLIPSEYACYTNITIFISFASVIYFLGIQQSLFSYFHQEKTPSYRFSIISSVCITLVISCLFFSSLVHLFREQLSQLILKDPQYGFLFTLTAFILFLDVITGITLRLLNIMEFSTRYALLGSSKNLCFLILVLIGAIIGNITIHTLFHYLLLASLLSFLFALIQLTDLLRQQREPGSRPNFFSFKIMENLIGFGLVMIPGALAMLILRLSDRYMLTYLSPNALHDVGIYAIGYKVGMIMAFLTSIVTMVYFPYAMKIAGQPGSKENMRKTFNSFLLLGTSLGVMIILFSKEIFRIFIDPAYDAGSGLVLFGVGSHFLLGVYNIIGIGLYIRKKAGNLALAVGFGAGLNLFLNFIFIPEYGVYGAGISSIIAYSAIVLINFVSSKRIYNPGIRLNHIVFSIILLISAGITNHFLPQNVIISVVKTIVFLIIIGIILYIMRKENAHFLGLNALFPSRIRTDDMPVW